VSGAARRGAVVRRKVACGAASGKSLADRWASTSNGGSGLVRSRSPAGAPVLRDKWPDRPAGHGTA